MFKPPRLLFVRQRCGRKTAPSSIWRVGRSLPLTGSQASYWQGKHDGGVEGRFALQGLLYRPQRLGQNGVHALRVRRQNMVRDLCNALAAGDMATAERLAHTTKGVSASVGATAVQAQAGIVKGGAPAEELERLELPLKDLIAAIEAWLPQH